jgi:regulator of RNase E activity RraA
MGHIIKDFETLSTCDVSDALDKLDIRGAVVGIKPLFKCPRIVGPAVTIKMTAAGLTTSKFHVAVETIDYLVKPGDIIVIDNGGQMYSCWGNILGFAAKQKKVKGVVIDGAARDVEDNERMGFPVYARGAVPMTARGRIMQEAHNIMVRCGNVQVRPDDIVMADVNGVVIIPQERAEEVLQVAKEMKIKENVMMEEIKKGKSIREATESWEQMLK